MPDELDNPGDEFLERKLATILSADVAEFSRLMAEDEERTLRTFRGHKQVIESLVALHRGRIFNTAGDAILAEFGSAVEAVRCATEVQAALGSRNDHLPPSGQVRFRIGINLGDVMVQGQDLLGDGVNVAARLQTAAKPGGICISGSVHDQIRNKLSLSFQALGEMSFKNIPQPVPTFCITEAEGHRALPSPKRRHRFSVRPWVAISTGALVLSAAGFFGWRSLSPASSPLTGDALRWYQEGINALRDGTYFKASKALERAVTLAPRYALAHAHLAEAWMELEYTDKARDEMLKANPPGVRRSLPATDELHLEAIHLTLTNDFTGAVSKYQKIQKHASEADLPDAYLDLGRAYQRNEKPKEAIQSYEETIRLSPQYAAAFLRLGTLYMRAKNAGKANQAFEQAEALYRSLSNNEGLTEVLYQRATAAESSHPKEAAVLAEQTIATAKTAGSVSQQINALMRLSSIEYKLGDSAKAQQFAKDALEFSQNNGLNNLTPRALILIGNASFARGEPGPAIQYFNQALDYARRYAIRRQEMNARFMLASVLVQQGNLDEGLRQIEPALDFFEQGGYRREASQALLIVIRAKRKQGNYTGALQAAVQQVEIVRQMDDRSLLMLAEESIGNILTDLQRFPEALTHYREYYAIAGEIGEKNGMGYALLNIGGTLGYLGRDAEARDALKQAVALAGDDKSLQAQAHLSLADVALVGRRIAEARMEAGRALDISESSDAEIGTGAYRVLGACAALAGHRAEAIQNAEQALDLVKKSGLTTELSETLLAFAEIRLKMADAAGAAEPAARAQQMFSRAGQLESEWRAWVVVAAAAGDSARVKDAASHASACLAKLAQLWGNEAFQTYLSRQDIQQYRKILHRLSQEK